MVALGYGLAAVVAADQLVQLGATLPLGLTPRLAWFQFAVAAAPRLLLLIVAGLITLWVGVRLRHKRAVGLGSLVAAAVAVAALLVVGSVLWDGAYILGAYGPPGGNLAAFHGQRVRALLEAGFALVAGITSAPAVLSAWRSFRPQV